MFFEIDPNEKELKNNNIVYINEELYNKIEKIDDAFINKFTDDDEYNFNDEYCKELIRDEKPFCVMFFKNNEIRESALKELVLCNMPNADHPEWVRDFKTAEYNIRVNCLSEFDKKIKTLLKDI